MLFQQPPTVGTLYQPHITITQICSTPPASNVENISSRISYAGLLIHYLTQNVRPKFHLCVNVFSNIIERKGPEAAVKISESLNHNLSADSVRLAKNALLSALVLQKQTDTAASHLRLLLLQQDGYWWLDIAVLADLLQLYMTVDLDDDLEENSQPSHRRERALEASQLYTDIISVNDLSYSQVSDDQVHWENIVQDETYPSSVLLSGSSVHAPAAAINRIHEYGARAFADNEEWEKAVLAVACIGERHLATDALVLFNSRLLSRLVRLEDESSSKSLDDESVSKGSDRTERYSSSRRGLALELALLQPLHLLPPECSILHSCLFQMSSSPGHTDRLIQHIREISERRGKAATNADIQSPQHDPVSTAALIPDNVASELIERLFLRSCTATQLTEAILLLWGTNTSNSIVREEIDNNALRAHQNDAIASIIDVACAIRDAAANKSREVEVGVSMRETPLFSASKSIADLSSKIATALISPCCDSLFTVALNPSLRLLLISLKRANLQHLSSSILQSIVGMTEIQDPELSAWYPDAELLAEALCIGFSQSDPTAVYHEVLDRVKAGEALDAHLLFATFR